ncbi:MAG: M20/M25/M40 family metallo-hydrolase [Gemmatimonadota bacterium]|nr:M20/M25/M40 family metallo-hydrolase [Gemmatimonadota bacterium]
MRRFTWPLVLLIGLTQACSGNTAAQGADTARGVPSAASRRAALSDPETGKIMARLSALSADSMEGRLVGSPGGARARGWIIRELQTLGVAPITGAPMNGGYEQPVKFRGRDGAAIVGANVVARIPGRVPNTQAIVLSAHYDHLGTRNGVVYNGADDDASGCIALLTIAERLKKSGTEHDVILVFFDAEESNLVGANAFVEAPALPLSRIAIDINLDMVSRQDGGALWVSGVSQNAFLKRIVDPLAATAKVKVLLGHDTKNLKPGDDWTNSSDHGAFNKKGIPFLYLGVEDHSDYHKPGDDPEKIDPTFYRNVIDFSEALLRAVDVGVNKFPAR